MSFAHPGMKSRLPTLGNSTQQLANGQPPPTKGRQTQRLNCLNKALALRAFGPCTSDCIFFRFRDAIAMGWNKAVNFGHFFLNSSKMTQYTLPYVKGLISRPCQNQPLPLLKAITDQ